MKPILYVIETTKPTSQGGGIKSKANFSRLLSATVELAGLAHKLTTGEIGSIRFICHEPPPFQQNVYFAEDVPLLIAALKEARL